MAPSHPKKTPEPTPDDMRRTSLPTSDFATSTTVPMSASRRVSKTQTTRPSTDDPPMQRQACRCRYWMLVLIAEKWFRRMGKALVPRPTVAAEDDEGNEFGRCKACRENCFRGSTNDLCQVCLRCNVDYQYQNRTFPDASDQPVPSPTADTQTPPSNTAPGKTPRTRFPRLLRGLAKYWLSVRRGFVAQWTHSIFDDFA